ncbi:MAG TPA: metalloregulator ArsR/SmtB family transcription factor [Acidimicrobiales bacterium]|nr:metalloregulator ArsR/SmtB family transcription factor [Acidimicrobiales bacterium]
MAQRRGAVEELAADGCCPSVLGAPLAPDDARDLAQGFTALADPVRLRVLSMLAAAPGGEVCVCDFVAPLGKSQPTISHHLKVLGDAGLVHGDRRGRWVWYSLDRDRLASLRAALGAEAEPRASGDTAGNLTVPTGRHH